MSNLTDIVGGANMYGGSSYSFTYDRFCNAYSAIYFNVGFLQVPSGVYFSGDFTITAWIYLLAYQSHSRIIDFGNGAASDNVVFAMMSSSSSMYALINNATSHILITTPSLIQLNTWYHVAFVFKGTVGYIYVNGNLATSGTQYVPRNVSRSSNYIGKSNWINNQNANATYDDLRIYAEALSATQILTEYITSSNNGIYVSVNN
jgi:hypothetical protein